MKMRILSRRYRWVMEYMIDEESIDCFYLQQRSPYADLWWETGGALTQPRGEALPGSSAVNFCPEICSSGKGHSSDSVNMFGVKFGRDPEPSHRVYTFEPSSMFAFARIYSVSLETLCR